ncbi:MAG TPA: SprT-like domain-containing protein [Longimicrobiaceae bacterium]|nr:SprT-like domain-containing protein [Longimicrobiaceae bacterium]
MSLKDTLLDLFGFVPPSPPSPPAAGAKSSAKPPAAPKPRKAAPAPAAAAPEPKTAPSAARDEAAVLAIVCKAGGGFRRVIFTRNRRVMASVAEGGAALRLNEAFASAPEAVLAAVATLFSARERRRRAAARETVRRFIREMPAAPAPARRARRVPAADRPHLERLRAEFERVNREHFHGGLPDVPLFLSGRMRSRNGHFSSHPLEIVISRRLCTHAEPGEAERTLRHEMIHLWQHAAGSKPDHGREFRAWARRLGVHPRATRPVVWKSGA